MNLHNTTHRLYGGRMLLVAALAAVAVTAMTMALAVPARAAETQDAAQTGTQAVEAAAAQTGTQAKEPVDYVNPYMGNISQLLVPTYPTVGLPNGMLRVYPQRADYTGDLVRGLPLYLTSHRSPFAFSLSFLQGDASGARAVYDYHYDNELVRPYFYSVRFEDDEVGVEFAPARRSAIYSLTFERDGAPSLVIGTRDGEMIWSGGRVSGSQRMEGGATVYICAEFSVEPSVCDVRGHAEGSYAVVTFPEGTRQISMRYGISLIDAEQAGRNLAEEIADYDLGAVARAGRAAWNAGLGKIAVTGCDEAAKSVFYTAMYRIYERMVCITEDGRYYNGFDGSVHEDDTPFYTDDWIWDTHLAAHPLRVLIDPEMEADMLNSYVRMGRSDPDGWMPTFPKYNGDMRGMNCNHVAVIMTDAMEKGLAGVDYAGAYDCLRAAVTEKTLAPWPQPRTRGGELTEFYWKNGYFPALRPGEEETVAEVNPFEKRQPVAVTLGTSYDEWCLSKMAAKLGRAEDADFFAKGSLNYRNLFNSETLFFHPKDAEGRFIEPFDYERGGGLGARDAYDENTGWVYRWYIQHNIADLVNLYGGAETFTRELDRTFATQIRGSKYDFYHQLPDHTGIVGQFSMANEPCMHVPYLYCYAGSPWKTQKRIRTLLEYWFRNDLMGNPGDEDGGGMSAFVVFSMMGFYPVTPGLPMYVIGSPQFETATLSLPEGRTFTVKCDNYAPGNKYIQSATLNGEPLDRCWLRHEEVASGGVLEFVMGDRPNKAWAAGSVPPSWSME